MPDGYAVSSSDPNLRIYEPDQILIQEDTDGDGLGAGASNIYCSAFVPSGWVTNNVDSEPNCFSNDTDECGICGGDNTSCADCAGIPNGSSYEDECNICDADPSNDCVQDCAGVWGGSALEDDCGSCVEGTTGLEFNYSKDCADVCGGTAIIDDCNVCSGGSLEHTFNSDIDCSGDCFGTADIDACGTCSDGDTGLDPLADDLGCGCFTPAPEDYWPDVDADTWGSGNSDVQ